MGQPCRHELLAQPGTADAVQLLYPPNALAAATTTCTAMASTASQCTGCRLPSAPISISCRDSSQALIALQHLAVVYERGLCLGGMHPPTHLTHPFARLYTHEPVIHLTCPSAWLHPAIKPMHHNPQVLERHSRYCQGQFEKAGSSIEISVS